MIELSTAAASENTTDEAANDTQEVSLDTPFAAAVFTKSEVLESNIINITNPHTVSMQFIEIFSNENSPPEIIKFRNAEENIIANIHITQ